MATWTQDELTRIGDAEEIDIAARRPDGSLRQFVTIWVVRYIVWSPTGLLGFDRPGGFALVDPDRLTLAPVGLHIGRFPSWVALGEG